MGFTMNGILKHSSGRYQMDRAGQAGVRRAWRKNALGKGLRDKLWYHVGDVGLVLRTG